MRTLQYDKNIRYQTMDTFSMKSKGNPPTVVCNEPFLNPVKCLCRHGEIIIKCTAAMFIFL